MSKYLYIVLLLSISSCTKKQSNESNNVKEPSITEESKITTIDQGAGPLKQNDSNDLLFLKNYKGYTDVELFKHPLLKDRIQKLIGDQSYRELINWGLIDKTYPTVFDQATGIFCASGQSNSGNNNNRTALFVDVPNNNIYIYQSRLPESFSKSKINNARLNELFYSENKSEFPLEILKLTGFPDKFESDTTKKLQLDYEYGIDDYHFGMQKNDYRFGKDGNSEYLFCSSYNGCLFQKFAEGYADNFMVPIKKGLFVFGKKDDRLNLITIKVDKKQYGEQLLNRINYNYGLPNRKPDNNYPHNSKVWEGKNIRLKVIDNEDNYTLIYELIDKDYL